MAALESPCTHSRVIGPQPVSAMSAFGLPSQTSGVRNHCLNHTKAEEPGYEFSTRTTLRLHVPSVEISQRYGSPLVRRTSTKTIRATTTAENKYRNHATLATRASSTVDKYGQCKCIEDAFTSIMKDTIQHCLHPENDVMRGKVVDQMGQGLAALCRVSAGVAAEFSNAPTLIVSLVPELSTIKDEDLEQVRRLLQLTSLPFQYSTDDEDFKRLTSMLQAGDGKDSSSKLTDSELSQICERLGSDLVQCIGPVVMCFPELPLWAKHRALLLPAEIAGKVALSLLTGPSRRR